MTAAGAEFVWRRIDRVRVKGKEQAIDIHEPVGRGDEVPEAAVARIRRYESALERFAQREFTRAEDLLAEVLEQVPADGPARRPLDLARRYAGAPPGADWDGVTRYDVK